MTVSAKEITANLLGNFRFKKQFDIVCQEVGQFSSDFIAIKISKNTFVEIEVKISKADFLNDFKKQKHEYYLSKYNNKDFLPYLKNYTPRYTSYLIKKIKDLYYPYIPHRFYFCVPEEMEQYCLNALEDFPYGLLIYQGGKYNRMDSFRVSKRPKALHKEPIEEWVKNEVVRRMSSDIANTRMKLHG